MSTQKGNTQRNRPQKHKNTKTFKNSLHDTSKRTKTINSLNVSDVCARCKDIIEWKIKYKKYKPLTQPKKCVKCDQKTVKQAYHVMCSQCGRTTGVCTKCCQSKELIVGPPSQREQLELDREMRAVLKTLPERKRRTFLRFMSRKVDDSRANNNANIDRDKVDLMDKLNALKLEGDNEDDSDFDDEDDSFDDGDEDDDDDEESSDVESERSTDR